MSFREVARRELLKLRSAFLGARAGFTGGSGPLRQLLPDGLLQRGYPQREYPQREYEEQVPAGAYRTQRDQSGSREFREAEDDRYLVRQGFPLELPIIGMILEGQSPLRTTVRNVVEGLPRAVERRFRRRPPSEEGEEPEEPEYYREKRRRSDREKHTERGGHGSMSLEM